MEPPPSFNVPEGMISRLVKAVYGTKQGGRIWYNDIRATLQGMGYRCTTADHAVFTHTAGKLLSIIALYVDDITMVCKDLDTIQQDKAALQKQYQMTDLGEIAWILGMHITRNCKAGLLCPKKNSLVRSWNDSASQMSGLLVLALPPSQMSISQSSKWLKSM